MMSRRVRYAGGLMLAAVTLGWLTSRAEGANLDKGLLKDAGAILDALAEKGVRTVGVLPFRVKKGARQAGFNAAPLATGLPGRLENALIVGQSGGNEAKAIGVLRDATSAASKNKVGSWATSKAAFDRLFSGDYEMAWGSSKKKPDGFLVGEVVSTPEDRYHTQVEVQLITPKSFAGGKLVPVKLHTIKVDTDRSLLRDMGYAYALPRSLAKKRGVTSRDLDTQAIQQVDKEEKGQKQAATPEQQKQTAHSPAEVAGFRLDIEYNGVKQSIRARDGGSQAKQADYRVDGAQAGQKVMLYLTRVASDEGKLGAVIKVNGKSLFEEQDAESIGCKKWIYDLKDKDRPWDFAGYYGAGDGKNLTVKEFTVLTPQESEAKVSELGSRAGWIDVDIFASGVKDPPGQEQELLLSTRGAVKARARSLKDVQEKIALANNLKLTKSKFNSRGGSLIFMDSEPKVADPYTSDQLPNPKRVGGISVQYYDAGGTKTLD